MTTESPAAGMSALLAAVPTWMRDGRCRETDPELFFPETGAPQAEALKICQGCEVRTECMEFAIEHGERGVWGGTSSAERRRIRKEREPQAEVDNDRPHTGGKPLSPCGTRAAYLRHWRRGEEIDEACQQANTRATQEHRTAA